ncbi:MAG: EAL domain-containing protein (putative c-di-GMP-specific phosphodiesterase class I) [Halioglobus sp.]|jgi:EAL domain-containing protein (putative c-di-GMP-specific phosphodiesterase class I)
MQQKKNPIRERKAIMIRPSPDVLEAMQEAASREGISLNKLALEIIESSGRLGTSQAAGARAELGHAVSQVESAVRDLRAALD